MKLTLLGTGGPHPDPNRLGSATALQIGDDYLLFDAGRGVVLQLVRAGIPFDRLHVFITHHHYDHIGDLADLALTSWLQGRQKPLPLFGPPGTTAIVSTLFGQVYGRDIAFRCSGTDDLEWASVASTDVVNGLVYEGGKWRVYTDMVLHGINFTKAFGNRWTCLGYRVEAEGKVVTISGDCVDCEGLGRLSQKADVLVQCCYLAKTEITTPVFTGLARDIIACADTVGKIATQAGVRQLVLTHFRQKSEAMMQEMSIDVANDYAGPVILGKDLLEVLL